MDITYIKIRPQNLMYSEPTDYIKLSENYN